MFLPFSWILGTSEWMPFDSNTPTDCFLQGLVGACAISVLCSLMRVYYFLQTCSDSETESKQRSSSPVNPLRGNWRTALQFWSLTLVLSLVGSRVSSLIVLEFSLRAASSWASAGLDAHGRGLYLLLLQCQFSLGCCFTCALVFLHQGAPHSSLNLFLAAAISWALASVSHSLWSHVARHYPLHSTEPYCGKCITLLTSGHTILTSLQRAVVLAFAFATVASFATVYDHFLSQKDALKFWTPLTLCYTMLVIYIQADQNRQTGAQALWHTAVLRLGALLVLMLTVGDWSDVLHILISFLGEAACLLPSQDLLQAVSREEEETSPRKQEQISGRKTFEVKRKPTSDDS
ncbi:transmembrane protein 82-like isoform X1 [Hippoglossus hippoglossus]|uniref:transmembrane protein 82-like isoform X1 n=1 Tax=Hippoglossus hippoglossus TaxID=8267 RepID=UPI00148D64CD|nr:transmembrane protein 82-like isoform X1 [Hippoglossus hippoglossus]